MGIQNLFARLSGKGGLSRSRLRSRRKLALPEMPPVSKLPALYFETLEPRLLLSASPFIYDASFGKAQDLTLSIEELIGGQTIVLTNNNTGNIEAQQLVIDTSEVRITLSADNDRLVISSLFKGIVPVSVQGGPGSDVIESGIPGVFSVTGIDLGGLSGAAFAGMERAVGSFGADRFTLLAGGQMTGGIEGGGGADIANLGGAVTTVTFQATSASTANVTLAGATTLTTGFSNVENFSDRSFAQGQVIIGADQPETLAVSQSLGQFLVNFGGGMIYGTLTQTGNFQVSEGLGIGRIQVVGDLVLPASNLTLAAERIEVGGFLINTRGATADGSVSLVAVGTMARLGGSIHGFSGQIAFNEAAVTVQGAKITSGSILVSATANVSQTVSGSSLALSGISTNASVVFDKATLLATAGAITVLASTTNTSNATVTVKGAPGADVDAGLAYTQLDHSATVSLINVDAAAATNIDMRARQTDSLTTTANGAGEGGKTLGAVAAVTQVTGQTLVTFGGAGSFTAGGLATFDASTDTLVTTTAQATAGGTTDTGGGTFTEQDLAASGARTGDGAVSAAAAFAWNVVNAQTQVLLGGAQGFQAAATTLRGMDSHRLNASADASFAAGDIAAAVAINGLNATGGVQVDGSATATTGILRAQAGEAGKAGSLTSALAVSGSSAGKSLGGAGALALNDVGHARGITLGFGARFEALASDVSLSVTGLSADTAVARAATTGKLGVGASVALNLLDRDFTVRAGDAAVLNAGGALVLASVSRGTALTEAVAGASGGTALTPVFAMTISDDDTTVRMDNGPGSLATGAVTVTAARDEALTTTATGTTSGSSAAIGASVALTLGLQDVAAEILRDLSGASIALTARQNIDARTTATAAVTGARQSQAGDTADAQAGRATGFASAEAGQSVTSPDVDTPQGDFGLAAALGIGLQQGSTTARIGLGSMTAPLGVTVLAQSDVDSAVLADGSVVVGSAATMPNVGIGAAVALNLAQLQTQASVEGAVTGSLSVEAGQGDAGDVSSAGRSVLSSKAVAGAGAAKFGLAGAVALTSNQMGVTSGLGIKASLAEGSLSVTARNASSAEAIGSADARLGAGGTSATGVGIGIGVGLVVLNADAVTVTPGSVKTLGLGNLTVTATTDHIAIAQGAAGVAGGSVAIAPSVGIVVAQDDAVVNLEAGNDLLVTGAAVLRATSTLQATATADAAAKGATAALGLSFAMTLAQDNADLLVERGIVATKSIELLASQRADLVTRAKASAAGVAQEAGSTTDTADEQTAGMSDFTTRNTGASTPPTPSAESADGSFGLGAAVALSLGQGGATVRVQSPIALISTEGDVIVQALSDMDAATVADGSTVAETSATRPTVGIGAAVALTLAERVTSVTMSGQLQAGGAVVIRAGQAPGDETPDQNVLTTTAIAGAGAAKVGVAGSFALTLANLDATADVTDGAAIQAGAGAEIVSASVNVLAATATANAAMAGGAGVGIGAGVALVLADADALTRLGTFANISVRGGLTMTARSESSASGRAEAGAADASVAVAPAFWLASGTGSALVLVETGDTAKIGGDLGVSASDVFAVNGTAGSAASGSSAALGLTVALSINSQTARVVVGRSMVADGAAAVSAVQRSDIVLSAVASAKGVTQETTGTTGSTSNDQIGDNLGFADGKAAPVGGGATSAPSAESSDGAFGLAAVLALSIVNGGAQARIESGAEVIAMAGEALLRASSDVDSNVTADASVVKGTAASDPNVGVGAAVAINLADRTTLARVDGRLIGGAGASVRADMAEDPLTTNRSALTAKAVSGAGATKAAISGAFAMNLDQMSAVVDPGARAEVAGGTGAVTFFAAKRSTLTATATANAALGTGGTGVGVGAGVALNLVLSRSTAVIDGSVTLSGAGLTVQAVSDHASNGTAQAGATNGDVGVAPSVFITVNAAHTEARLVNGAGLSLTGDVTVAARSQAAVKAATSSAASGASAGLGISLALSVQAETVLAILDRPVKTSGSVLILANQRTDVALNAVASASGVDAATSGTAASPKADNQMGKELGFANAKGGTSTASPQAGSSNGSFGLAAAVALSVLAGRLEARTGTAGAITADGSIEIAAQQDVDSAAVADASVVKGTAAKQPGVGVGAAIAINIINRAAEAGVGADLVAGKGIKIAAIMAPDPDAINRSTFVARAVSGVGAANTGVSGAFALNQVNLDALPQIGNGVTLAGGTGQVQILAQAVTSAQAVASADATLGTGGSKATGTGIGAALAMNLLDSDSVVVLPGLVNVTGAGLVLSARGDHIASGEAAAGAAGAGTAVAPSVYLVASTNNAVARVDLGADLSLDGGLTLSASEVTTVTGTAKSAAKGASAAVGATVTLAVVEDSAEAVLDRGAVLTGAVSLRAVRQGKITLTSTASAAGETQASSGGKTSADQQVGQELSFLNAKGGSSGATPGAQATDSSGDDKGVGIAAALSLSISGGVSLAEIRGGRVVVTPATVTVEAQGDTDSSVTADGKAIDPKALKTGVGAAVAINVVTNATTARVAGDVTAGGLSIRAGGVAGEKPQVNVILARAVAGASASDVGVAGAFAMNLVTLPSTAELTGTARLGLTGSLFVTGSVATNVSAIGTSKAIAATDSGSGGSGTSNSSSVGVGASFALNILNSDAVARIADGAEVVGGLNVTLTAKGSHDSVTRAVAGAGGNVGIAPSLALLVSGNETHAVTGAGSELVLQGNYSASARQRHGAVVDTDASAVADKVAVGAAVSIAILPERAVTSPGRSIQALGAITLAADLATSVATTALASTQGVAQKSGEAGTSDQQSGNLLGFADRKSGQSTTKPDAAKTGGDSGSTSVGVAASLALNVVTGEALSELASGLRLKAGGAVTLEARLDLDATASGDGSSSAQPAEGTTSPDYGIGVGVGLNVVTGRAFATVHGLVEAGGAVTLTAGMSAQGDGVHRLNATGNAGAGGSKVGVAGAFAMNISTIQTRALSDGDIQAGGVVTLQANSVHADQATASSKATIRAQNSNSNSSGNSVGVGASVAINLLDNDTTAEVAAGSGLTASGGLALTATASHVGLTKTEAGAKGDVAITPSVALTIALNDTAVRLGAGTALVMTGGATMTALHDGTYATTADSEAGGKDVAVGAAIAVAIVTDKVEALAARSLTASAGGFSLRGWSRIDSSAIAKGGASGNDSGSKDADSDSAAAVNNNSAVTSRAGTQDVPKGQDGVNQGNAQTSGQTSGKKSSGVGVGAAIAVNAVVVKATATIADGVVVDVAGDATVSSALEVDAKAEAQGTALDINKQTNIGAAVAVNVVVADNLAHVGVGATLKAGNNITVSAGDRTDRGDAVNSFSTRALAASGADQTGVAGSIAVNITSFTTRADVGAGSTVSAGDALSVTSGAAFEVQNLAGAAAYGGSTAVGAAVVVNVAPITTEALIGTASTVEAGGLITVSAFMRYQPKAETILGILTLNVTSVAMGGGVSRGNAAVAGSVAVDVVQATTHAEIGDGVSVNRGTLPAKANQAVTVQASSAITVNSATGGLAAATGTLGLGLGITVGVLTDRTSARIGSGASVGALGVVSVQAQAAVTRVGIAATIGVANTTGIAGSILVDVLTSRTEALVGDDAVVTAGALSVRASDRDVAESYTGAVAGGGTAGIGLSLGTLVHDDLVSARIGDRVQGQIGGDVQVTALSVEEFRMIAVGGSGGGTAGVAVTPAVSVLTETTTARVGADTNLSLRSEKPPASLLIRAEDATTSFKVAGAAGFGGTAGVGVGVDVTTLTKTTTATLGAGAQVLADGSVELRSKSTEDVTSFVVTGAAGGTVAVNVSTGVFVSTVTTRSEIEGGGATRTLVDAGENVVVEAISGAEYDLFAGGIALGGTAGIGASVSVPVITKRTDAAVGSGASVTGRALGRSAMLANGSFGLGAVGDGKATTEVKTDKAGPGVLQFGDPQSGAPTDTNGNPVDPGYEGNAGANAPTTLTAVSTPVRGVAIAAVNHDDLAQFAVNGAAAGTVAVSISGAVAVVNQTASVRIETGAEINRPLTGVEGARQDVMVVGANLFRDLTVAAAAAVAGTVAVAPSAGVIVLNQKTDALIRGGANVEAMDTVLVLAKAKQDITTVEIGVAGATVAVGASVGVLALTTETRAHVGTSDGGPDVAAQVRALNDMIVRATSDTEVTAVTGGIAGGIVGVGGSVNVSVLTKETSAKIADGSVIEVDGKAGGADGIVEFLNDIRWGAGTPDGLSVQAGADETLTAITFAGGFGYVGLAGAVTVALIDSDTTARIGNGARINLSVKGPEQAVRVQALNRVTGLTFSGGLGAGLVGVGGSVTVGIIHNATKAEIGDGAVVFAGGDVVVNATSLQDITSFAAAAAGGVAGVALSAAVWVIGGDFATDGGDASESDWVAGNQGAFSGSDFGGFDAAIQVEEPRAFGAGDVSTTNNSINLGPDAKFRTGDAVVFTASGGRLGGLVDGRTYYTIYNPRTGRYQLAATQADAMAGRALRLSPNPLATYTLERADTQRMNRGLSSAKGGVVTNAPGGDLSTALVADPLSQGTAALVGAGAQITSRGGLQLIADDQLSFVQVVGTLGAGGVGFGASVSVLVHDQPVLSRLGNGAVLALSGYGLDMAALSVETIRQIAAGASGGVGAASGAVVVNSLNEVTRAELGTNVAIRTTTNLATGQRPDISIIASDATLVSDVSGAAGFGAAAGVGVGVDVTHLTKSTNAVIGTGAALQTEGSLILRANAIEDMASAVVTGATGVVAGAGSVSVLMIGAQTTALILGSERAGEGSKIRAKGNVVVEATDRSEVDIFAGAFTVGAASIGAGAGVPVITRLTRAEIGDGADLTALGLAGTDNVEGWQAIEGAAQTGDVALPELAGTDSPWSSPGTGASGVPGAQDTRQTAFDDSYATLSTAGRFHRLGYAPTSNPDYTASGVVVSARTGEDIAILGIAGGVGALASVNFSGAVTSVTDTTTARIGRAVINGDTGAGAGQQVKVLAETHLVFLSAAVAASASLGGAISPSASVGLIGLTTRAEIAGGAKVNARDGILVAARSVETMASAGVGVALAGALSFGGSAAILSLTSATTASIGNNALVTTDGSVRVEATDDSRLVGVVGSLGAALGGGAGTSAQVAVITKTTLAQISDNAVVEAGGAASQSAAGLTNTGISQGNLQDSTPQRGVVIHAESSESLAMLTIAGGAGLLFGLGGAAGVILLDSDTMARIGTGAKVTARSGNVAVTAVNSVRVFQYTGGAALGGLALSGAVTIGILRNGTVAQVESGADVMAAGDISVRALTLRDISNFTASATGGLAAGAGSLSFWQLGGLFSSSYGYDEQSTSASGVNVTTSGTPKTRDGLSQNPSWVADQDKLISGDDDGTGTGWEGILDNRQGPSSRFGAINGQGRTTVAADGADGSVAGSLGSSVLRFEGTQASITDAARLQAGATVEVLAEESTRVQSVAGGQVLGGLAGGVSVAIVNNAMLVSASLQGSATARAVRVLAEVTNDFAAYAMVGTGGLATLGAQVAVVHDGGTLWAQASGGTLTVAAPSEVAANRTARLVAQTSGVTLLSAVTAGVSVAYAQSDATTQVIATSAFSDTGQAGVGSVSVRAVQRQEIRAENWGVGIGLVGALNGSVAWAEDVGTTTVTLGGVQALRGRMDGLADVQSLVAAKAGGVSASLGIAVGGALAMARLRPSVTVTAEATGASAALTATAAFNADPVTGSIVSGLGARAEAFGMGASLLLAGAGGLAMADVTPTVSARNTGVSALREARAYAGLTAVSRATGLSIGLLGGAGASVALTTVGGTVGALVGGTSSGGVVVDARTTAQAQAFAEAASVGLLSGTGNAAFSTVTTETSARLEGLVAAGRSGVVQVTSRMDGQASAEARGVTVGLLTGFQMGSSPARATFGGSNTASSTAGIAAATSVDVAATGSVLADASSGGSGGNVTASLVPVFGGVADAVVTHAALAELGGSVVASREVRVRTDLSSAARASVSDRALGLAALGRSRSTAVNTAASTAQVRSGASVQAGSILVEGVGSSYVLARGDAAAGGLGVAGLAVLVEGRQNSTVRSIVNTAAVLTASGGLTVASRNVSEGDAQANGVTVGLLLAGGSTQGSLNLSATAETQILASARLTGGTVAITAEGGTTPAASSGDLSYAQSAADLANDVIRITNHGLVSGQQIQLGTSTANAWADPGRVYSVLTDPTDPSVIRLGAGFDAARGVNAATDVITFDGRHGFRTGDQVVYQTGGGGSVISGTTPTTLWVLVLDDQRIKLLDYDPAGGLRKTTFSGLAVDVATNRINLAGHGLTTGTLVTYHAPRITFFNAGQVDLSANGLGSEPGSESIHAAGHLYRTGDVVTYGVTGGPAVGGLVAGTRYVVTVIDANRIRLSTEAGIAVALTPDTSATGRTASHSLTPVSAGAIGGLVEGQTYRVQSLGANAFQLRNLNGTLVTLGAGGANGQSLVREGVDLVASGGAQRIFIDMRGSAISGALTGPGGVSLSNAVFAQGDGRSRLLVDGFAAGLAGISANASTLNQSSTVRVLINEGSSAAPTRVTSTGGNVTISSRNLWDAAVDSRAGGAGAIASGTAFATANINHTTLTQIGRTSFGGAAGALVISAKGSLVATATEVARSAASATTVGGGAFASANADAVVNLRGTNSITFGAGTLVTAGANITALASSSHTALSTMAVAAGGFGVSANAGENGGGTFVTASGTFVEVAARARLVAPGVIDLGAQILNGRLESSARTDSGAAGGDSDARSRVEQAETVGVFVRASAVVDGATAVRLRANPSGNLLLAKSSANLAAAVGDTDAQATELSNLVTQVTTEAGSLIRTSALSVDAGAAGAGQQVLTPVADRSGALIDTGVPTRTPVDNWQSLITFNGNVRLLRDPAANVALVVNAAGIVTTARGVRVEGGNGVGYNAGADGVITLDTIAPVGDGSAVFAAAQIAGTGGVWTVEKGVGSVSIVNESTARLVLGNVNAVWSPLTSATPAVRINVGDAAGFKFDVVTVYDVNPAAVSDDAVVRVIAQGDVELGGVINNPLGLVQVRAAGSIQQGKAGLIVAGRVELEAGRDLGDKALLQVKLVRADSREPVLSLSAGRDIHLAASVAKRDLVPGPVEVSIPVLRAGGVIELTVSDAVIEDVIPATHGAGITVGAVSSAINNAAIGNAGAISTPALYREFYYPDSAGPGLVSPDVRGVFGQRSGFGDATWNFLAIPAGASITAVPQSAKTTVKIVDLGGAGKARATVMDATPPAAALPGGEWVTGTATGAIDWKGLAA